MLNSLVGFSSYNATSLCFPHASVRVVVLIHVYERISLAYQPAASQIGVAAHPTIPDAHISRSLTPYRMVCTYTNFLVSMMSALYFESKADRRAKMNGMRKVGLTVRGPWHGPCS